MDARRRNALIAVIVLIVIPGALIVAWRVLRGPGELVDYRSSGGFFGTTEELTVYRDGRAMLSTNGSTVERELDADELEALQDVLEQGDWPQQPRTYGRIVPDCAQIDIAYDGRSVRAYCGEIPPWLDAVMRALLQVVADVGG